MKKILTVATVFAMAVMFAACGVSWDTMKYNMDSGKVIQASECIISIAPAPVPAPVIPAGATKIRILEPVMFDFDKSVIRADQDVVINKVADLMARYPDTVLALNGHASTEGPEKYNLALSQRRANKVKNVLVAKGVPADRIVSVVGKGEVNIFGELLKLNRRVVVLSVE